MIEAAAMILALPGGLWLAFRYSHAQKGTYPVIDAILSKWYYKAMAVLAIPTTIILIDKV
jgi:hypothetical protein